MTIEEVLEDAAAAVKSARDVLEAKELALREILPPCFDLDDHYHLTSEGAADFLYSARDALDDAEGTLNDLIKAAGARSLNADKDQEVDISRYAGVGGHGDVLEAGK